MTDSEQTDWIQQRIESREYGPGTSCSTCGITLSDDAPAYSEFCRIHSATRSLSLTTGEEPMTVVQHRDEKPDVKVPESDFDTVGISVHNAIPAWKVLRVIENESLDESERINRLKSLISKYGDADE